MLTGDFNARISGSHINYFDAIYLLKSLIRKDTCYKNPDNLACVSTSEP